MKIVPKKRKGRLPIFGRCCDKKGAMVETMHMDRNMYYRFKCSFCGNEWLYRCGITIDKNGNSVASKDDSAYGYYG
jgi:predicted RNA-binding Zn-ribbon protein involved in translation (DUF1610 family)